MRRAEYEGPSGKSVITAALGILMGVLSTQAALVVGPRLFESSNGSELTGLGYKITRDTEDGNILNLDTIQFPQWATFMARTSMHYATERMIRACGIDSYDEYLTIRVNNMNTGTVQIHQPIGIADGVACFG